MVDMWLLINDGHRWHRGKITFIGKNYVHTSTAILTIMEINFLSFYEIFIYENKPEYKILSDSSAIFLEGQVNQKMEE